MSVEKWPTPIGDYGKVYDAMYATIKEGKPKLVSDESAIANIRILAEGVQHPTPFIFEL